MNTKNNKRRRESQDKIERAFIELIQTREISRISVAEICKKTGLNRSTFYANYEDIYDLADKIMDKLENDVSELYDGKSGLHNQDWLRLLCHIRDNQIFYKTYFKLGYDRSKISLSMLNTSYMVFPQEHIEYHAEFFRAGFNAIVKKWLSGGCEESPEEINEILASEYRDRRE